jgi:hypothetical protein
LRDTRLIGRHLQALNEGLLAPQNDDLAAGCVPEESVSRALLVVGPQPACRLQKLSGPPVLNSWDWHCLFAQAPQLSLYNLLHPRHKARSLLCSLQRFAGGHHPGGIQSAVPHAAGPGHPPGGLLASPRRVVRRARVPAEVDSGRRVDDDGAAPCRWAHSPRAVLCSGRASQLLTPRAACLHFQVVSSSTNSFSKKTAT